MILKAKINGLPCELEIEDKDLSAIVLPRELSVKDAAKLLGVTPQTIYNRKIPKNKNGKISLATLESRMK